MPTRRKRKERKIPDRVPAGTLSAMGAVRARRSLNRKHAEGVIVPMERSDLLLGRLGNKPLSRGFREGDYLHVSDLLYKCMRMIALSYSTETKLIGEPLWDNMQLTFAIGRAVESFVVGKAIAASPGIVYGDWHCVCEKTRFVGVKLDAVEQDNCNHCKQPLDNYGEVVLKNDEIMVSGSADLTFLLDGAFYFNEIKSIKKEDWEALVRPVPVHILQIVFYWWLARELKMPLHQQVSVLYASKAHTYRSPLKEFTLNPEEHLHRLDDFIDDAKALLASRRGGPLPCRDCPTAKSPQAKKCEMSTTCFAMGD